MSPDNSKIKIFIGAIVMIILQVFLAPIISISSVIPNFLLAYTIAVVVARPDQNHLVFAFFMGLIFDFITNGPVGSMAFIMVLFAFISSLILNRISNINLTISILIIILAVFLIELCYGTFMVSLQIDSTFIDMLKFRVLPCTLYDVILGVVIFPIMVKLITPMLSHSIQNEIDNTRW